MLTVCKKLFGAQIFVKLSGSQAGRAGRKGEKNAEGPRRIQKPMAERGLSAGCLLAIFIVVADNE